MIFQAQQKWILKNKTSAITQNEFADEELELLFQEDATQSSMELMKHMEVA